MKRIHLLALVSAAGLLPNCIRAESIFDRHDRRAAYLFVDNRGRRVGDLLTVRISVATDIDQKEKRALSKKNAAGGNLGFSTAWSDGSVTKAASGSVEGTGGSNRSFDGAADFSSQRDMSDQLTVTVIDVLPNGNLVIEGNRNLDVSGEVRCLRITGVVRPADVSVTNVIESRFIAEFKAAYVGNGVDSRFVNQGWFSRAMNKYWPF